MNTFKKILIALGIIFLVPAFAFAATAFNSGQVGGSAANGFVLQTNGSINTWVATSTLGFTGGSGGVSTFNTRSGAVTLTSGDVTTALTFTPYNATNPSGYITSAGAPVQSVFSRTGAITAQSGDYTTAQVTESGNLYFTNARAQSAITLTTTGSSGAATYTGGTLNIPQYSGGGTTQVQLPSYTVGAANANFTTVQAALDACGTAGGGNIILTDHTYSIGATGLLWKGSNCSIYGRGPATTTIAFTGATTAIKTNSAAGQYTHDEIHNIFFSGPANTTSVAIDWSNMTHGIVDNVQTTGVGTSLLLNDTQNITFYNSFTNLDFNDNHAFCINASSTNPVNANLFSNIFCGDAATSNVVGVQLNNSNGNTFNLIDIEPGSLTGTVGLKIFDNKLATNNGVFNNSFDNLYVEANATGVSIATTVNPAAGGIQRNIFNNITSEANTTDWSVTAAAQALNTFQGGYDSNFGAPLTSLQGPVGIGTSTEMQAIGTTPFSYFGVNASTTVATNEFVVDNNTSGNAYRTDLLLNSSGYLGLNTTNPTSRLTVADLTSADAIVPTVSFTGDTNFAKTAQILKVSNNNASDSGTTTQIINVGTGPSFEVDDQTNDATPFVIDSSGYLGIGTTTPAVPLTLSSTTATTQFLINRQSGSFPGATGFDMNVGSSRLGAANDFRLVTGIGMDGSFLSSSERFTVLNGGNVGVATTTPWRTFSVNGTVSFKSLTTLSAQNALCISGTTNEVVTAGASTCSTSSKKTKHDITAIPATTALDEVLSLKPVAFTYNETGERRIGFVAEDVSAIDPRLVDYASSDIMFPKSSGTIKKGEPLSVEYANITALLVKVAQKQQEEIGSMKRSVEENWQWLVIGLLVLYVVYNEVDKRI